MPVALNTDPGSRLLLNMTPELAIKTGKLVGTQCKNTLVSRDSHLSSAMVEQAFIAGVASTGGNVFISDGTPSPALPFCKEKCDCYVNIATDDIHSISGLTIHNPDGSFFDESQLFSMTSKEARMMYPDYRGLGSIKHVYGATDAYMKRITRMIEGCECQIVIDSTFEMSSKVVSNALTSLGADVIMMKRANNNDLISSMHETDLRALSKTMLAYEGSWGFVLNSSGSRIAAFDEDVRYINSDMMAMILTKIMQPGTMTIPIDMTMGVDDISNGVVIMAKRNIMSMSDIIKSSHSDFGIDRHGHVVFPNISYSPDGIMTALKLAEIATQTKLHDIIDEIPVYPKLEETIRATVNGKIFEKNLMDELSKLEYESLINLDGIRVNFDSGWFLIEKATNDDAIYITCEARDKAYLVGLMEIAKSVVNETIKKSG